MTKPTDTHSQQFRLLQALKAGPVNTLEARAYLGVMHPAARIQDLRRRGHEIGCDLITVTFNGFKHHRIARYRLLGQAA